MQTYHQRVKIQACTGFEPMTAQLVERCTGIAEVMGSNPVQAEIFSGLIFTTAKVVKITARITFIQVFIRSSNT